MTRPRNPWKPKAPEGMRMLPKMGLSSIIICLYSLVATYCVSAEPNAALYRLSFAASPPSSGASAKGTWPERKRVIIRAAACGDEGYFFEQLGSTDNGEDRIVAALGKLLWIVNFGDAPCRATLVSAQLATDLKERLTREFPEHCAGVLAEHDILHVPRLCLKKQANTLLLIAKSVTQQLGSSDVPCFPPFSFHIGLSKGEWDISVRDLTRIYLMDRATAREPKRDDIDEGDGVLLDRNIRIHIRNNLLTADGPPGDETYSYGGCGNQENSTGSPAERAEEGSWVSDVFDALGDFLDWLRRFHSTVVQLARSAVAAPFALLGAAGYGPFVIPAAADTIVFGRISETENHLLMIE